MHIFYTYIVNNVLEKIKKCHKLKKKKKNYGVLKIKNGLTIF
jgi:hypothetical protein